MSSKKPLINRALTTIQAVALVSIVLIAAVGGYWWYSSSLKKEPQPTPSPVELPPMNMRYSKFGFSFDYPEGMTFATGALLGGFDHARPLSGDVQGMLMQIPESVGVIWNHADESPSFDLFLDELWAFAVEAAGFQEISRGNMVTSTKGEDEMVLQPFDVLDAEGTSQTGILGVWYEEKEQRIYTLYMVTIPEVAEQIDMNTRFQMYLDSFDSEGWEPNPWDFETYWPTEGWRFAIPEDVGINPGKLQDIVQHIKAEGIGADSVMVVKDGYVVLDAYFPPFDEGELHIVYSCTKSVVSTLIGIAIEKGYIEAINQTLLSFFPNRSMKNVSQWKEEITLRDMLIMSAGFDARDSYLYDWEWLDRMHNADDALQYVLDLEMAFQPGTKFEYTNGVSHLLSCLVTEITGMSALDYARQELFEPIGITESAWTNDSLGRNWGYSNLYLTPHDMAKIGYLFLHGGEWDGEQIIPMEWVEEATAEHIHAGTLLDGYGYQWWTSPKGYYSAIGYKGQFIDVVPDLDVIMVTTSRASEDFLRIQVLLEDYVISAVTD